MNPKIKQKALKVIEDLDLDFERKKAQIEGIGLSDECARELCREMMLSVGTKEVIEELLDELEAK